MPFRVRRSVADTLDAQHPLVGDSANTMPSAPSLEQRGHPSGSCPAPTLEDLAKCGPGSLREEKVNLKTGIS